MEASGFRDAHEAIAAEDGLLLGISSDSVESHRRFRDSLGLPFHLLSDRDKRIMRLYGVTRRLRFLPNKRVTFVVGKDGVISGVYHHELAFKRHVEQVVAGLRMLNHQ